MFGLGLPEAIIILVVFGIFMFGSTKVSDFARTLGRFSGDFKKGRAEIQKELQEIEGEVSKVRKEIVKK